MRDVGIAADRSPTDTGDVGSQDVELHNFAVAERFHHVTRILARDAREVDEDVFAGVASCYESVAGLCVEPLDDSRQSR